jgi:hypothetical protein
VDIGRGRGHRDLVPIIVGHSSAGTAAASRLRRHSTPNVVRGRPKTRWSLLWKRTVRSRFNG